MTNEIKRRRKPTIPADRPITLDERRALDRANITKILKEYQVLLPHWNDILSSLVQAKQSQKIFALKTVHDFIDGFELQAPEGIGIR